VGDTGLCKTPGYANTFAPAAAKPFTCCHAM